MGDCPRFTPVYQVYQNSEIILLVSCLEIRSGGLTIRGGWGMILRFVSDSNSMS